MPVARFDPDRPAAVESHHSMLRRVRCIGGRVTARVDLRTPLRVRRGDPPVHADVGPAPARWSAGPTPSGSAPPRPVDGAADQVVADVGPGRGRGGVDRGGVDAGRGRRPVRRRRSAAAMAERLADTISFWENWFDRCCSYDGEHHRKVHRSALILKALTYAPTGAVVAAGTTSLPEWIGGERNWDYRFTWIRDATLTLSSLVDPRLARRGRRLQGLARTDRRGPSRGSADHVPRHRRTAAPRGRARPSRRPPRLGAGAHRQRRRRPAPARLLRPAHGGRPPVRPSRAESSRRPTATFLHPASPT